MKERLGTAVRFALGAIILGGALAMGIALYLLAGGRVLDGVIVATVTWFGFRWSWRATLRRRELLSRGYYGSRIGSQWIYEEVVDGFIEGIELPLEYLGRGEYEIHVPGERDWAATMPAWARERRAQIVERLGTMFKYDQIRHDPDSPEEIPQR
jgi:hypothetical protein